MRFSDIMTTSEMLWEQTRTEGLSSGDPRLEDPLRLIENFLSATLRVLRSQHAIGGLCTLQEGPHIYLIQYSSDESTQGLKTLTGEWGGDWGLLVNFYQGSDYDGNYQRLHEVAIKHRGIQVHFLTPKEDVGQSVYLQSGILPTDIEITPKNSFTPGFPQI